MILVDKAPDLPLPRTPRAIRWEAQWPYARGVGVPPPPATRTWPGHQAFAAAAQARCGGRLGLAVIG
jgi:hypothetical protein